MKIYKITYDSWKSLYGGYWSSLEKAFAELSNDAKFRQVLNWNKPRWHEKDGLEYDPDETHNSRLKPLFSVPSHGREANVVIENYKYLTRRKVLVPEVKVAGEPYQPAKTVYDNFEEVSQIAQCGYLFIEEIELDVVGN